MARKKKGQSKGKDAQPIKGVDYEVFGEDEYQVTKDEMISLAEAINAILDPDADGAIDLESGIKELGASITEFFDEIFTSDGFEDEQWATLYKMECMPIEPADDEEEEEPVEEWPEELMEKVEPFLPEEKEKEPEPEPEPKKKGRGKKKKEPEPEPEEEEEKEVSPEEMLSKLKKLKTKKDMDQFVEDNNIDVSTAERNPIKFKKQIGDVIKGVSGEPEPPPMPTKKDTEKKASKKEKDAPEKEKAAPKKEKAKRLITTSKRKSHEDAFMDSLDKLGTRKEGVTLEELAEKGNQIYCRSNKGSGSTEMQKKQGLTILKALERYGIVEKEKDIIFLLEEE